MIYLIESNMFVQLGAEKIKSLTARDTIILLSFHDDTMPISMVKMLSSLKANLEIKELPECESEEQNKLIMAYTLGRVAEQYKQSGKIRIYSENLAFIAEMPELGLIMDDEVKKAPKKPKTSEPKAKADPKEKKPVEKAQPTVEEKVLEKQSAEPSSKRGRKKKNFSIVEMICERGGEKLRPLVESSEAGLIAAIKNATDAKIGLRTQLQMLFLEEKGWEDVLKILQPEFETLKKSL